MKKIGNRPITEADTDCFQQWVLVSAADFRGRNNRPSAKHIFIKSYVHTLAHLTL